jgi:hypothetical protein
MKMRNIILMISILIILIIIKILTNKYTEKFYISPAQATAKVLDTAKIKTESTSKIINDLEINVDSPTMVPLSQIELDDSNNRVSSISAQDKRRSVLLDESNGKYIKHNNKKCQFLDIGMECQDVEDSEDCTMNCAENCEKDDKCISFEYSKKDKRCKLSSSCDENNTTNNDEFELYFKRGAVVPPLAQFTQNINKQCNFDDNNNKNNKIETKINTTISDCAQNCIDNPKCISFEYKKKNGNDYNVCSLTKNCHRFNFRASTKPDNSDVFINNKVKVIDDPKETKIPCKIINTIYYNKILKFYWHRNYLTKEFRYNINSRPGSWIYVRRVPHPQDNDWQSMRIPPRTILYVYDHWNYRGERKIYYNTSYNSYTNIPDLGHWRDGISSFKIRSI